MHPTSYTLFIDCNLCSSALLYPNVHSRILPNLPILFTIQKMPDKIFYAKETTKLMFNEMSNVKETFDVSHPGLPPLPQVF